MSDAVDDYVKARENQFNTITKCAYTAVVVITILAVAMSFA